MHANSAIAYTGIPLQKHSATQANKCVPEIAYVISMGLDTATFEDRLQKIMANRPFAEKTAYKNGMLFCTTSENVFFPAESSALGLVYTIPDYQFTFHTGLIFTLIEKFVGVYTIYIPVHSAVNPYCQVLTAVICWNILKTKILP